MSTQISLIEAILGGMGVNISSWPVARNFCIAAEKKGKRVMAVVSSTALPVVFARRLQLGDLDMLWALENYPLREDAEWIKKEYYIEGGKNRNSPFKPVEMFTVNPSPKLQKLTVIANFAEVLLARQGHSQAIGINMLEKVQMPHIFSIYGAMLAGVRCITMGAGLPTKIPDVLDSIMEGREVTYRLEVHGSRPSDDFRMKFNPESLWEGASRESIRKMRSIVLERPWFLPVIMLDATGRIMKSKTRGRMDGCVVENKNAGGHVPSPRGWKGELTEKGEPRYSERDVIDYLKINELGVPFWKAGGMASRDGILEALKLGARGSQIGTIGALSDESGLKRRLKKLARFMAYENMLSIQTNPTISPSGYPFQVADISGTLSKEEVMQARKKICDLGYLVQLYRREDGSVGYRCPAEKVEAYLAKGGKLEDTIGKGCLCNALLATGDLGQLRNGDKCIYVEPPVVTLGKNLSFLHDLMDNCDDSYSIADVVQYLFS